MKFKSAAIAVLTLATSVCGSNVLLAAVPSPQAYHAEGGWDTPPAEYREIGRRGFQDGIEGARKDFENHRKPNVKNRDEYRHPSVGSADRDEYRAAFRRGYDSGVEHLMHDNGGHY
jgi:ribosome modulation factor